MVAPPKPITAPTEIPSTARSTAEQTPRLSVDQLKKTRADIRVEEFRRIIQQKGYFLVWRKAILCTCFNAETEQAKADCSVCDGSGYFYIEPLDVQGIMTNLEKRKDIYRNLGTWLEGSSMVTIEPEFRPGYRDSYEMVHSIATFNEWITKGNRRGPRSKLPANHDVARYRIVKMLHMLRDVDGQPVGVEEKIHFEITDDGWIKWIGAGREIPDGTVFSINYEFHPVWIVVSHPHALRDTVTAFKHAVPAAQAMPVQAAVKLDYLIENVTLPSTKVI